MPTISEDIFREYDIRGLVKSELQDEIVKRIAGAFATVYRRNQGRRIALGMDGRPSSPHIRDLMAETLSSYGLEIWDLGLVPTPLMYFAVFKENLDGGLIITASHNPPEYNGIKALVGKEAQSGEQIREIYTLARDGHFPGKKPGSVKPVDLLPDYIATIRKDVRVDKSIKAVVDCGNGTGGLTALPLYRELGIDVIELFCDVDGTFPNHHPDPTKKENLEHLIARVRESGADLGIGFDGDADRIGVVDEKGSILWGDQLMVIFSRDVLKQHPGGKIISEVKASETLYSEIEKLGGKPIMWKTGHSVIKKKIFTENAVLAGEVSGHMFFNDRWFGFDDAVYAGARLFEILGRSNRALSRMLEDIPTTVTTPEIRVDIPDRDKFRVVEAVAEHFKKSHHVIDIDGARITFPHGWALVRASNTQPSLVLRFEADTQEHLKEIRAVVEPVLERIRNTCR